MLYPTLLIVSWIVKKKLQMIKNLISLSREHKFMDYEGLKCLKDNVDKRVKELKGK